MAAVSGPRRIQLSRAKGWRLPPDAVNVARPSRWGNPWTAWRDDDGTWWASAGGNHDGPHASRIDALDAAVRLYREDMLDTRADYQRRTPMAIDAVKALRGRDLACWCPPYRKCHADVLLELANAPLRCEAADG